MPDVIKVQILDDGSIKFEVDKISGPNHVSAEAFLREVSKIAGVPAKVTRKSAHASHGHSHSHGQDAHQH